MLYESKMAMNVSYTNVSLLLINSLKWSNQLSSSNIFLIFIKCSKQNKKQTEVLLIVTIQTFYI